MPSPEVARDLHELPRAPHGQSMLFPGLLLEGQPGAKITLPRFRSKGCTAEVTLSVLRSQGYATQVTQPRLF